MSAGQFSANVKEQWVKTKKKRSSQHLLLDSGINLKFVGPTDGRKPKCFFQAELAAVSTYCSCFSQSEINVATSSAFSSKRIKNKKSLDLGVVIVRLRWFWTLPLYLLYLSILNVMNQIWQYMSLCIPPKKTLLRTSVLSIFFWCIIYIRTNICCNLLLCILYNKLPNWYIML